MSTVSNRAQGALRNNYANILLLGFGTLRVAVSSAVETACKKSAAHEGLRLVAYSGGAGSSSVAVGLARTLRVGELVELIDVGLATMTSMVENMCGLLVRSYLMVCPCLTRPGFARRFSYVVRANAGGVGATLRVQTRKAPGELGSCVRRSMVIVIPRNLSIQPCRQ